MGFFGSSSKTINQFSSSPLYKAGMTKGVMTDQLILSKHSGLSSSEAFKANMQSLQDMFNPYQLNGILGSTNSTSIRKEELNTSAVLAYIQTNIDAGATSVSGTSVTSLANMEGLLLKSKDTNYDIGDTTFTSSGITYNVLPGTPGVLKYKESDTTALASLISYNGSTITTDGKVWNVDSYSAVGDIYTFAVSYSTIGANGAGTVGSGTVILTITNPKVIDIKGVVTDTGNVSKYVNLSETTYAEVCTNPEPPAAPVCTIEAQTPAVTSYTSNIAYGFKVEESYITSEYQLLEKYCISTSFPTLGKANISRSVERYINDDPALGTEIVTTYYDIGAASSFVPAIYTIDSISYTGSDLTITATTYDGEFYNTGNFVISGVSSIDYKLYSIFSGIGVLIEYVSGGVNKLTTISNSDSFFLTEDVDITPFVPLKENYVMTGESASASKVALRTLGINFDGVDENLEDSKIRDAYMYLGLDLDIFYGTTDDAIAVRESPGMAKIGFTTLDLYSQSTQTVIENVDDPSKFKVVIQQKPGVSTETGTYLSTDIGKYSVSYSTTIVGDYDNPYTEEYLKFEKVISTTQKEVITVSRNNSGYFSWGDAIKPKDTVTLNGATVGFDKGAIPIPISAIRKLGYQEKINMYDYCLQIGVRVLYTVSLKWYQTSFFRALTFIASVYLASISGGTLGFIFSSSAYTSAAVTIGTMVGAMVAVAAQTDMLSPELQLLVGAALAFPSAGFALTGAGAGVTLTSATTIIGYINTAAGYYFQQELGMLAGDLAGKQKQLEDKVEDLEEKTENNKNWNLLARYDVYEDPKYDPFASMDRFWDIAYGRIAHNYDQYYVMPSKLTL